MSVYKALYDARINSEDSLFYSEPKKEHIPQSFEFELAVNELESCYTIDSVNGLDSGNWIISVYNSQHEVREPDHLCHLPGF